MQTFDVLIAPGPSSNSVSCFFLFLLLLFLLPLLFPCGEGSLRKTGKEVPAPPACLPTLPGRSPGAGWVVGLGPALGWLFAESGWRGQGCPVGMRACLLSCQAALLPGAGGPGSGVAETLDRGWGPLEDSIVSGESRAPRPKVPALLPTCRVASKRSSTLSGPQPPHLYKWKRYSLPCLPHRAVVRN